MPETRGVPLEEMDTLFGGVNHKEAGRALEQEAFKAEVEHDEKDIEAQGVPAVPAVTK